MSDISCRLNVDDWFGLFAPEWYDNNILEVYLSGVHIPHVCEFDLCENWVEYRLQDVNGFRLTSNGEVLCERSYGRITLKIRRI